MRYKHHKENYIKSLEEGIMPSGLQIKKKPAFLLVSKDFESKWNAILYEAEKNIIKLLMYESDHAIAKIEVEIQEELKEEDPNRSQKKINQLENKHANFRKVLEKRRSEKWQKFKTATKSRIQSNLTLTEKVTESRDSIKISSKQSGNYPNNEHNILTSREGSSNINLNKSLISGSSSNATGREEENHLNGINRFITDNKKTREKYKQRLNRTKETVTTVKSNNVLKEDKQQDDEDRTSYAEAVKYNRISISNDTVNLSEIYNQLLEDELNNTSKVDIFSSKVCTNSASSSNGSDSIAVEDNHTILSSQDEEVLSILEELQKKSPSKDFNINSSNDRISGYFCSDPVFNLSKKILTDIEIKVFEKGLDYAPIQNKINEPELRRDFEEFCRRMRLKWHFLNEPTPYFKKTSVFTPKSTWKPPKGHPNLEVF